MTATHSFSKLKKITTVLLLLVLSFFIYVIFTNRNARNMTIRQKILKAVYPIIMLLTKKTATSGKALSNAAVSPTVPIYDLPAVGIDGGQLQLNDFKGKKILLVNTASDCGYTGQYAELEKLYLENKQSLVIIGVPANDFKEQEKGTDENIAAFCKANFDVSFPLLKKSKVVKGSGQNEIFQWLSDKNKNGWNDQAPTWNFCKYLVDENGKLVSFFASAISPLGKEMREAIEGP